MTAPGRPARDSIGAVRWSVVSCALLVAAVSFLDRSNISIAASLIQEEYAFSDIALGSIFGAFLIGYALAQPLAGQLADRYGPYRTIACGILWWSAFTALMPLVPSRTGMSLVAMLAVRLLLGVGEAVIFPASNRLIASWIPSAERGLANGLVFAGVGVGGGFAPPFITHLMLGHGWRAPFYSCALIGLAAAFIWLLLTGDRPQHHRRVSARELAYIEAGMPRHARATPDSSWRVIAWDRQVMLLTASYFCYGYVAYIFFTWFFKYLSEVRALNLQASAAYATLPFIAMTLGSSLGGLLSDWITRHFGKRWGRCGLAVVSLVTSSIFVWSATRAADPRMAAVILAGGAGALYFAQSTFWAVSADIGGPAAGRISGVMNMGCQIGGVVTASLTPLIATAHGWTASFTVAAAIGAMGGAVWIFINPSHVMPAHVNAESSA